MGQRRAEKVRRRLKRKPGRDKRKNAARAAWNRAIRSDIAQRGQLSAEQLMRLAGIP